MTTYPMTRQGVRNLSAPAVRKPSVNVGPTERAVSTLTGSVMTGWGVAAGGLLGMAVAAAGAGLVYRGVTGHCTGYAAAGVSTASR